MNRRERDEAIAAAFKAGEPRGSIGARYGITPRRVSQIAASFGLHRYDRDQVALGLRNRGGRPRDTAIAALGPDIEHYAYLRRLMGAAYAREAMGIAA